VFLIFYIVKSKKESESSSKKPSKKSEKKIRCPNCGSLVKRDKGVCSDCGSNLGKW